MRVLQSELQFSIVGAQYIVEPDILRFTLNEMNAEPFPLVRSPQSLPWSLTSNLLFKW